jgi:hypothetical protein
MVAPVVKANSFGTFGELVVDHSFGKGGELI